jgi:hypothetical protein
MQVLPRSVPSGTDSFLGLYLDKDDASSPTKIQLFEVRPPSWSVSVQCICAYVRH